MRKFQVAVTRNTTETTYVTVECKEKCEAAELALRHGQPLQADRAGGVERADGDEVVDRLQGGRATGFA